MGISWQPRAPRGVEIKAANGRPSQQLAAVGLQTASSLAAVGAFSSPSASAWPDCPPAPQVLGSRGGTVGLRHLPLSAAKWWRQSWGQGVSCVFCANLGTRLRALGDGQGPWKGRRRGWQSRCCEQSPGWHLSSGLQISS